MNGRLVLNSECDYHACVFFFIISSESCFFSLFDPILAYIYCDPNGPNRIAKTNSYEIASCSGLNLKRLQEERFPRWADPRTSIHCWELLFL
jgi:hypothetical protein